MPSNSECELPTTTWKGWLTLTNIILNKKARPVLYDPTSVNCKNRQSSCMLLEVRILVISVGWRVVMVGRGHRRGCLGAGSILGLDLGADYMDVFSL